ncbi:MAG: hypothetical protein FWH21_05560 [Kiritimatiellaeota bacterium]|nr:hypothetical protein [Kiritimatiellota bacterium]
MTDEHNELERFAKTSVRNTRLVNRAKIILALDTSGGRFRWQLMAADGSRNWKRTELSALAIQCLGSKRIPSVGALNTELAAWYVRYNASQKGVDWQFSADDARRKLKRLYPTIV